MNGGRSRTRTLVWVALGLVLILTAVIVVVVGRAGGPLSGSLQLVALGADGRFGTEVELAAPAGVDAGYPLVLAVTNQGHRPMQPRSLQLAFPSWFRLLDSAGAEYAIERSQADPLARVTLGLEAETFEPGAFPLVPAGLDQLRLNLVLSSTDCRLSWNGVPEFEPSPPWDPERVSDVAIYWSFDEGGGGQAGLLRLRIPAGAIPPPLDMEFGEPTMHVGAAPRPDMGPLTLEYSVTATCGEPERPLNLLAVAWAAESGGRLIVVSHEDRPRLHLFDIDGDGRIDLEIRDTDGDGILESRRPVSFAIPAFLTPQR